MTVTFPSRYFIIFAGIKFWGGERVPAVRWLKHCKEKRLLGEHRIRTSPGSNRINIFKRKLYLNQVLSFCDSNRPRRKQEIENLSLAPRGSFKVIYISLNVASFNINSYCFPERYSKVQSASRGFRERCWRRWYSYPKEAPIESRIRVWTSGRK